jgi:hypothetical protein
VKLVIPLYPRPQGRGKNSPSALSLLRGSFPKQSRIV